jgi:fatty-acyl-CoA synthase
MHIEHAHAHGWYHRTISQLFQDTCRRMDDKAAIVFEERQIRYCDLFLEVQRVAQGLLDLGVGRGHVVSILPSATPEFATIYFATLQIGAIVNPLNLLWGSNELRGVLQRNEPTLIVAVDRQGARDTLGLLHEALPDLELQAGRANSALLPSLRHLACVGRAGPAPSQYIDFDALRDPLRNVDQERLQTLIDQGQATDIQFMCQTSGTTSLSKTALWDHRPPLATAHFAARNLRLTPDDRYINLAPFYHNSGINALTMNLAYAGTTLYLVDGFEADKALRLIQRHRCTCTFGFDAHWQGMARVAGARQTRLPIRKVQLAGEARTHDLVRSMCEPGAVILGLYAQTENGPLVSLGDPDCVDDTVNKHTHGRPLPGVQVVIKDIDTGKNLPQGEAGEICYRSLFLFRGYHRQPEETRLAFDEEGYFHSGDYGHLDNGYLTYLGRLGGVVKSGGENVSTTRVTTQLSEIFRSTFDDVKTIGVEDAYWGTKVVSFVRMREGHQLPPTSTLREACKGHMAMYEVPRDFLQWEDQWPMTPEGKIDFKLLASIAREPRSA